MRNLSKSRQRAADVIAHKGLAFDVADLIRARSWARFWNMQMNIRLDHGTEHEEFDEVVEFRAGSNLLAMWIMWHSGEAVFLQPILGKKQRYNSVLDALEGLRLKTRPTLTDITATAWPGV